MHQNSRTDLIQLVPEAHLNQIREGMRREVQESQGKTRMAQVAGVEMAGMTGTVQRWLYPPDGKGRVQENQGWFIGYAPYDRPTLAFAILAEGVMSGGDCAPVARQIVEQTLALTKADPGSIKGKSSSQEPEKGKIHSGRLDLEAQIQKLKELKEKYRDPHPQNRELERLRPGYPPQIDFSAPAGKSKMWKGDWTPKLSPEA